MATREAQHREIVESLGVRVQQVLMHLENDSDLNQLPGRRGDGTPVLPRCDADRVRYIVEIAHRAELKASGKSPYYIDQWEYASIGMVTA